jgi:hypothetical protein
MQVKTLLKIFPIPILGVILRSASASKGARRSPRETSPR